MPELPDLEVFAENLTKLILNKKIKNVKIIKERPVFPLKSSEFISKIKDKKVVKINRVGKQLLFTFDNDDKLLVHLMLHGELMYNKIADELPKFTCVVFEFEDNHQLIFSDFTQWMRLKINSDDQRKSPWDEKFGLDPLSKEFTYALEGAEFKNKKGNIKQLLMNQNEIGGLGNAYADEILWKAGIKPERRISSLNDSEINNLYKTIPEVLKNAIKEIRKGQKGGITGEIREFLAIHGKKNCPLGHSIKTVKIGGRGSEYCPVCQK
ncbi:MAG: DNA-formamidopyrimidine glycosylase family protein [Candidatus Firestonebacteria bacterium]